MLRGREVVRPVDPSTWNPRYLNYARSQGRTPEAQTEHDRKEWSGGAMTGFILWMKERRGEAFKAIPQAFLPGGGLSSHVIFDAWLTARVDELLREKETA